MINRERIVEVEWAGRPEKTAYAVKLLAVTENRTGMIAGITGAISDMKTGIRDARASVASDEKGHIEVTVEVFDVKHLDKVINSIKGVPGVLMWKDAGGVNIANWRRLVRREHRLVHRDPYAPRWATWNRHFA